MENESQATERRARIIRMAHVFSIGLLAALIGCVPVCTMLSEIGFPVQLQMCLRHMTDRGWMAH
jgi:hypothetical protein